MEAGEAEDGFDDAEDGFDGLFSFFVFALCRIGLQFVDHLQSPLRGYGLAQLVLRGGLKSQGRSCCSREIAISGPMPHPASP
jgi:hypothetical protein